MPRFDKDGRNSEHERRNDMRDRSVPDDENYYAQRNFDDFGIDKFSSAPVIDNQNEYNNYDVMPPITPPTRNNRQQDAHMRDTINDFSGVARSRDRRSTGRNHNPNKNRKHKKGLSRGKRKVLGAVAVILVFILLLNLAANAVLGKITYDDKIDNKYVTSSELKSSPLVKNILLLGVDARRDEKSETSRSDTMMLISIDTKHNTIKTVSFLRDTWVYIPCHDGEQRLNAACTYGGYNGVCDTIEYNFGIDIDGYVVVDFGMFQTLVDSLGGVEIEVTEAEANEINNHQRRYGNVNIESGKQILTGKQALAYCRIRKIDTDFKRSKRQRTVMSSIIKGIKSSGPITLLKMANGATPYLETNMSKGQIKRYAMRALFCIANDMVEETVPFDGTWEYATINGNSVISINKEKNQEKLVNFIYDKSSDEIKSEQEDDK